MAKGEMNRLSLSEYRLNKWQMSSMYHIRQPNRDDKERALSAMVKGHDLTRIN